MDKAISALLRWASRKEWSGLAGYLLHGGGLLPRVEIFREFLRWGGGNRV